MIMFEAAALGMKFALTRLIIDIPGIIIIALLLAKLITPPEVEKIYENAANL